MHPAHTQARRRDAFAGILGASTLICVEFGCGARVPVGTTAPSEEARIPLATAPHQGPVVAASSLLNAADTRVFPGAIAVFADEPLSATSAAAEARGPQTCTSRDCLAARKQAGIVAYEAIEALGDVVHIRTTSDLDDCAEYGRPSLYDARAGYEIDAFVPQTSLVARVARDLARAPSGDRTAESEPVFGEQAFVARGAPVITFATGAAQLYDSALAASFGAVDLRDLALVTPLGTRGPAALENQEAAVCEPLPMGEKAWYAKPSGTGRAGQNCMLSTKSEREERLFHDAETFAFFHRDGIFRARIDRRCGTLWLPVAASELTPETSRLGEAPVPRTEERVPAREANYWVRANSVVTWLDGSPAGKTSRIVQHPAATEVPTASSDRICFALKPFATALCVLRTQTERATVAPF